MAAPRHVLQTSVALTACSFLDSRALSSAEAAGLDRSCVAASWAALLSAAAEQLARKPLWRQDSRPASAAKPKEALRELQQWLRNLARVPELWAAHVRKVSDTDVEILPRPPCTGLAVACGAHHGGTEDFAGLPARLEPPRFAGVTLEVGCNPGEPISVGVLLASERPSDVGEAFLLGVELVSTACRQGRFAVYFSPVFGRVFFRFPEEKEGWVAQAMLPVLEPVTVEEDLQEVEAFVLVGASGCISFGRRSGPVEGIEWSREIGPDSLPPLVTECLPCFALQIDKLEAPAKISISWVGSRPPASAERDDHDFDAIGAWSAHKWE